MYAWQPSLQMYNQSHKKVHLNCNFIEKKTLAQVFFSEFCEIFKKTVFTEHSGGCSAKYMSASNTALIT